MKSGITWRLSFLFLFLFFYTSLFATTQPQEINTLPIKINNFINYMVKRYHFDREKLTNIFSQVHYNEDVVNHITHPHEEKPWNVYRSHFITQKRVEEGLHYWQQHAEALRYAERHYGIPPSLIIAIIGVETNYGEHTGEYSALNALSTLAFFHQSRAAFFTHELEELFLLTKEQQLPILLIKSSYAGALGIPQFMPSTYRLYAVNYHPGSHADLLNNNNDAIVSVANYLALSGWHKNEPVIACPVENSPSINTQLISQTAIPKIPINRLKLMGINPSSPVALNSKAAIVELRNETGNQYWLTFHNFRVIMRYNPRIIYSMAVYQLSQIIQKLHNEQTTHTSTRTTSARIAQRSPRKLSIGT